MKTLIFVGIAFLTQSCGQSVSSTLDEKTGEKSKEAKHTGIVSKSEEDIDYPWLWRAKAPSTIERDQFIRALGKSRQFGNFVIKTEAKGPLVDIKIFKRSGAHDKAGGYRVHNLAVNGFGFPIKSHRQWVSVRGSDNIKMKVYTKIYRETGYYYSSVVLQFAGKELESVSFKMWDWADDKAFPWYKFDKRYYADGKTEDFSS